MCGQCALESENYQVQPMEFETATPEESSIPTTNGNDFQLLPILCVKQLTPVVVLTCMLLFYCPSLFLRVEGNLVVIANVYMKASSMLVTFDLFLYVEILLKNYIIVI